MLGIIREAQREGAFREGDPMLPALGLWSTMHGIAALLVEGQLGTTIAPLRPRQ